VISDYSALKLSVVPFIGKRMQKPGTMSQVKSGLQLAALTLLFFVIAGLFFAGVAYSFFPTGHSRALGLIFLIISVPVLLVTMNRWVKVLAGLLALAFLNGLITMGTGHLLANPTQPMSRLDALYMTVFFAVAAALASTLKGRKLNLVDRIAVLAFVSSLALLMEYEGTHFRPGAPLAITDFSLMGIGLCCLLIAWGYGCLQRRRGHNLPGHDVGGPAGSAVGPIR
jgi:hypothetical protein